ncbi:MAG: hypothetical protein QG635_1432, partial [Bacteroidota bacterium]|nr:hypothetical protein [Bacteroidota bacterium]
SIRIGALQLNIYRMIFADIFIVITFLILGFKPEISMIQVFYLSISGLIGLVFGDSFLFKAFKLIGPRVSLLIMSINPAIAAILAYYFLHESLSLWSVLGIALTLSGIFLVLKDKPEKNGRFRISAKGVTFAFMGALGQAVGLIFAKSAFFEGDVNWLGATFVRMTASIPALIIISYFMGRKLRPIETVFRDKKTFKMLFLGSIIGPYLGITLSFVAVVHAKVGIASTLMSTVPIFMLPLTRIIYKEKFTVFSVLGAIITVIGVAILFL